MTQKKNKARLIQPSPREALQDTWNGTKSFWRSGHHIKSIIARAGNAGSIHEFADLGDTEGSLLWERRFFLLTCFFRPVEQPERELRSALRLTAVEVMS